MREINPLIAILAFDSACLPGVNLPETTEDTDGIRQVAMQISRSLSGTPFFGKGKNSIRAFTAQKRVFLDLSSAVQLEAPTRKQRAEVFTSIISTQAKDYWVMWMFMDGSQSGLEELRRDIRIAFAPSAGGTGQK